MTGREFADDPMVMAEKRNTENTKSHERER